MKCNLSSWRFYGLFSCIFLAFLALDFPKVDTQLVSTTGNEGREFLSRIYNPLLPLPFKSLRAAIWKNFFWHRNIKYSDEEKSGRLTTSELIERVGFYPQVHSVTTEDGYILTLHRISGEAGIQKNSSNPKRAILFFSGFVACSDSWLVTSPEKSLPFILAKKGYDVWLANPRNCRNPMKNKNTMKIPTTTRNHVWKNPNSVDYWDFSWHEIGIYDAPATIDYILAETGQSKLTYIGHSMGTTVNYVMLSERPEYNEKINMSISLAPVAFLKHADSPLRYIARLVRFLPKYIVSDLATGGSQELLPSSDFWHNILKQVCAEEENNRVCLAAVFSTIGFDYCQFNTSVTADILGAVPAGASIWTLLHYFQLANSGQFRQFDYGPFLNLIKYKNKEPPNYKLENIQSPQILFWSENDWLSHRKDVELLVSGMPRNSLKGVCRIKFKRFSHFDYILAKDVNLLVNKRVIRVLEGKTCWYNNNPDNDDDDEKSIKCPAYPKAKTNYGNPFLDTFLQMIEIFTTPK